MQPGFSRKLAGFVLHHRQEVWPGVDAQQSFSMLTGWSTCCRCVRCAALQLKQLVPRARIIGRTFPICQLDLDGVRIEISSMHTRTPFRLSSSTAASGSAAGAVPPDAAQVLQVGPKAAVVAAAAKAAVAAGQVGAVNGFRILTPQMRRTHRLQHMSAAVMAQV